MDDFYVRSFEDPNESFVQLVNSVPGPPPALFPLRSYGTLVV